MVYSKQYHLKEENKKDDYLATMSFFATSSKQFPTIPDNELNNLFDSFPLCRQWSKKQVAFFSNQCTVEQCALSCF
jgi:hypothetical protein